MSTGNTVKDGTGDFYWHLVNSDGELLVELSKQSGHSIVQLSADGSIKASAGVLYGLIIGYTGVTAGDKVEIKDGGSGGTVRMTVVLPAAQGTIVVSLPVPATFASSIYSDETKSGGTIYVTGIYD